MLLKFSFVFIFSNFFWLFDELLFVVLDMIKWIKAFRVVACSELFFADWIEIDFLPIRRPLPMNKTCNKNLK
jgi:hypothetical protein